MNNNILAASNFQPIVTEFPTGSVSTILDVGGFYETAWLPKDENGICFEFRTNDFYQAIKYHNIMREAVVWGLRTIAFIKQSNGLQSYIHVRLSASAAIHLLEMRQHHHTTKEPPNEP